MILNPQQAFAVMLNLPEPERTLTLLAKGIRGLGQISGVKYQATGITEFQTNAKAVPFETSFVNNFKIIGQGPGNNLLVHENFHLTVNANGRLTALIDNSSFECR